VRLAETALLLSGGILAAVSLLLGNLSSAAKIVDYAVLISTGLGLLIVWETSART